MNWERVVELLNKNVSVGVRDRFEANKLFYYSGKLTYIDDDSITLDTKKGVMFLQKSIILSITQHIGEV